MERSVDMTAIRFELQVLQNQGKFIEALRVLDDVSSRSANSEPLDDENSLFANPASVKLHELQWAGIPIHISLTPNLFAYCANCRVADIVTGEAR